MIGPAGVAGVVAGVLVAALGGLLAAARSAGRSSRTRTRLTVAATRPGLRARVLDAATGRVVRLFEGADLTIDPRLLVRRWAVVAGLALLVGGARWGVGGLVVVAALAAGVPAVAVAWRRGREGERFSRALPGVLEGVAGRLRAGSSLVEAVAAAGHEPTGSTLLDGDLRSLGRRVGHGQPFAAAVEAWTDERSLAGVRLVAAALVLGAEAGGARARALDGVAATLRDRQAIAGEVAALSSQARASAVVMMGAPVVFAALGLLSDPAVSAFLLRTPAGLACLAGGLALDAVAGLWMVRIARRAA